MSPSPAIDSTFSVQTFSIRLEWAKENSKTFVDAQELQTRLEQQLAGCRKILRWAIVQMEQSGDNTLLWCEGAYERSL